MTLSILVEPHGSAFRARTGSPFDITADAPTADAAVAAVRWQLAERVKAGAVVVPVPLPVAESVTALADHPLFDEWLKAVEECRREADAAEVARGN